MGLAVAMGRGTPEFTSLGGNYPIIREKNVVLFGVKELDELESKALKKSEIIVYSHQKIHEMTVNKAISEAIEGVKKKTRGIFFHLDVDIVNPKEMPAWMSQPLMDSTHGSC